MGGVNRVILIGNLGKDPEVRHLENGKVVANVTIATSESYKDRNGNKVDSTEWHDLEMWDGLAKIAEQYLTKGKTIYVEGKIKSDTWQDDQGNNRKKVRIRVQTMTMLGGTSNAVSQAANTPIEQPKEAEAVTFDKDGNSEDDDLPF